MASKFYRSSRGQQVDVSSLLLQQENTRAVGNMGVNARGDKIDSTNKIVKSRNQQIDTQYAKQVGKDKVVSDDKVFASKAEAEAYYAKQAELKHKQKEIVEEPVSKAIERNVEMKVEEKPKPKRKYTRRKTTTTKKTTTAKKTTTVKKVEPTVEEKVAEPGKNEQLKKLLAQRIADDVKADKPIEVPVKQEETTQQEELVLDPVPVETKTVEAPEPVLEEVKVEPKKPLSGLAAAMAKSRSVAQTKEKTARQQQQSQSGVKRI